MLYRILMAFAAVVALVCIVKLASADEGGFYVLDRKPVDGDVCIPSGVLLSFVENFTPGIEVDAFQDSRGYIARMSSEGVHVPQGDVLTFSFAGYPYVAVVSVNEDGLACLNRSKPVEVDIHIRALSGD